MNGVLFREMLVYVWS